MRLTQLAFPTLGERLDLPKLLPGKFLRLPACRLELFAQRLYLRLVGLDHRPVGFWSSSSRPASASLSAQLGLLDLGGGALRLGDPPLDALFERAFQLAYPLLGFPADGLELGRVALLLHPVAYPQPLLPLFGGLFEGLDLPVMPYLQGLALPTKLFFEIVEACL